MRKDDTIDFGPHWHLDCRLAADLPEDNIIRTRFLANAVFGAVTLALMLLTLWLGYLNRTLSHSVDNLDNQINAARPEVQELEQIQRTIAGLTHKIDYAYQLVGTPYLLSDLWLKLAAPRPDKMHIDLIEQTEAAVMLRGTIIESPERASRLLGEYVNALRKNPDVSSNFREISLTSLDRLDAQGDKLSFEVTLRIH